MAYKKTKHGVEMDHEKSARPAFGRSVPPKAAVARAGHELKENPPAQIAKTAKKFGKKRARAQKVAIMLAKARKGE